MPLSGIIFSRDFTVFATQEQSGQVSSSGMSSLEIRVDPQSFDVNVFEGASVLSNLVISNDGNVPFGYQIRARNTTPPVFKLFTPALLLR